MKDVAVYTGYTEVLKGAGDRLAQLRGEIAIRVVWEAVILAALIGKLCLRKRSSRVTVPAAIAVLTAAPTSSST